MDITEVTERLDYELPDSAADAAAILVGIQEWAERRRKEITADWYASLAANSN